MQRIPWRRWHSDPVPSACALRCAAILVGSVGWRLLEQRRETLVDLGSGNPADDGGGASSVGADDSGTPSTSTNDGSSPSSAGDASGDDEASNASTEAGASDADTNGDAAVALLVDGGTDGATASSPCAGGTTGKASDATGAMSTPVNGYGDVEFDISTQTQIVGLHTTLTVPAKPPASGTLFLWPGLQPLPGGKNYDPIGNGVLQPVLTWGGTCAPTAPNSYASWWISAQYVNTYGTDQGYTGCHGGQGMDVAVGDPSTSR